jgi:hypothetical protein
MKSLSEIYITRMTHIDNIPHILQHGITHKSSPNANPNYLPIGDKSLINSRDSKPIFDRLLGDFTPFYFGFRMPMLFVIARGLIGVKMTSQEDIVYCMSRVGHIMNHNLEFYFSDGHAIDNFTEFYTKDRIQDLNSIIDFKCIHAKYWNDENIPDLKRKKQAEFLVLGDIPMSAVEGFVVFNQVAKEKLLSFGVNLRIEIYPNLYF